MGSNVCIGEEFARPIFLAEERTVLNAYGRTVLSGEHVLHTLETPDSPFPRRPNTARPQFLLADLTNPKNRHDWLRRIYTLRIRYPQMPVATILPNNHATIRARAYAAGADRTYTNKTPLEQIYSELSNLVLPHSLSDRKIQILMGYSVGRNQQTLANELFIVAETIKSHTSGLFQILEAKSKHQLVHRSFTEKILPHPSSSYPDTEFGGTDFPLTPMETMSTLAIGLTGSQAGAATLLDRSPLTVKTHLQNIRIRAGWTCSESIANVWRWGIQNQYPALTQP